jgi:hypothetical protein
LNPGRDPAFQVIPDPVLHPDLDPGFFQNVKIGEKWFGKNKVLFLIK